ncbi:alpha/beta hydrolase [Bdellovibrionota bacterium FG-2]
MAIRFPALSHPKTLPVRALHALAKSRMLKAGFRWETRRTGDLQIGLWRKSLHSKSETRAHPSPDAHQNVKRIVWVPTLGDSPLSWFPVLMFLKTFLRGKYDELVVVDYPGFSGFLAKERAFHSLDLLFENTFDVFDTLKPHTLVGHGLGGWVAARYAVFWGQGGRKKNRSYDGPQRLVVVDPGGVFRNASRRWLLPQEHHDSQDYDDSSGEESKSVAFRRKMFRRQPRWLRFLLGDLDRCLGTPEIKKLGESVRDEHLLDEKLESLRCPVVVIWGEKDEVVPSAALGAWLEQLERSEGFGSYGVLLHGCGHSPHLEKPRILTRVLSDALKGKTSVSRPGKWTSMSCGTIV